MDRIIYTAMNGARQSFDQQAVASHNLANVSTPGFKAQLSAMETLSVEGEGLKTRALAVTTTPGFDGSAGPIRTTERALDVALKGNDWLSVVSADGTEAYTRRGDIQIDANGQLLIGSRPLMGEGGVLTVPLDSQVSVGSNGVISVIEAGMSPDSIAEVGRLKIVSALPAELERGDDGLMRPKAGGQLPANEFAQIVSGALEGSNVSPTEAMVAMIDTQRRYEMQMKVISSADDNANRANNLLSLS